MRVMVDLAKHLLKDNGNVIKTRDDNGLVFISEDGAIINADGSAWGLNPDKM